MEDDEPKAPDFATVVQAHVEDLKRTAAMLLVQFPELDATARECLKAAGELEVALSSQEAAARQGDELTLALAQPVVVARYFELTRKAERKGMHVRTTGDRFSVHAGKEGPELFSGDNVTALLRKVKAFKWRTAA